MVSLENDDLARILEELSLFDIDSEQLLPLLKVFVLLNVSLAKKFFLWEVASDQSFLGVRNAL